MTDEKALNKEGAEALEEFIKSQEGRGYPSFWHADKESQHSMEVSATQEWANELNKQDHSIHGIKTNPDDPPDCLAEMDGERIGVEVTELTVDEKERKKYVKAKDESKINIFLAPGQVDDDKTKEHLEEASRNRPKARVPNTVDWPFDKFRNKLVDIVQEKDKKMREQKEKGELISLDKYFLLIVTDEQNLWKGRLEEYLHRIKLPRPQYFDAIYIMMSYMPNDGDSGLRRVRNSNLKRFDYEEARPNLGQGHYPVFEVYLSSSATGSAHLLSDSAQRSQEPQSE